MTPAPRMQAIAALILALLLGGCASTGGGAPDSDPLEGYNRVAWSFNDKLDRWVLQPVARGYQAVTPDPVDRGISNFFGNLEDLGNLANNLLQAKFDRAVSDLGRISFNTTVGLFGFIDVATPLGFTKHNEDLGQTLGYWGVGPGPYLVIPFYGPSTVRDAAGYVGEYPISPYGYLPLDYVEEYGAYALRTIDLRADLLGTTRVLEEASFDPYTFQRDAFLQHRRSLVYDGDPPPEPVDDSFLEGLEGVGDTAPSN